MKNLNSTLSSNSAANAEDVIATKIFLRNQGHYTPPEWGISQFPDRAMFDALKAFQKSQGLKVDGVMMPEGETETAIKAQAQKLQSKGRNGDTILAHISPAEAQLLHDVTDGGSINPETGLPEFFFGDFFGGLSDSFSSIGTSISDSFSSFGDSMSSFGDSFSSGLSEIGDNISSSFSDTFGSDSLGDTMQNSGLDKISEGLTTPLDTGLGKGLGDTLASSKIPETSNFGGVMDNLKPSEASLPKSTPKIDLNPKPGQTHVSAAQQARNVKAMNQQRDFAAKSVQAPKKVSLTLNQKIEATTKKMNANRIAEQKAKPTLSQQQTLKKVMADAKAGRQKALTQNMQQQGLPSASGAKPLVDKTPQLSAESDASNARLAAASAKTSDHTALRRDVKDALKTGGAQAQTEVYDLAHKMDEIQPGSGTKMANDVGLKPINEVKVRGVPDGASLSIGTDNGDGKISNAEELKQSSNNEFNTDNFSDTLSENAESKSKGRCAAYVRRALEAGGLDSTGHPSVAKDWGNTLEKNGFKSLSQKNYTAQKGDVVVIQSYKGGNPAGHMAAHDGNQWISDFKQRDMWAGPGYRKNKPPYLIYRKTP